MPIILRENKLCHTAWPLTGPQIANLVSTHLNAVANTLALETTGLQLVDADFPDDALAVFVKDVCIWGGYPGISGRVLRDNRLEHIGAQFRSATRILNTNALNVEEALAAVHQLRQLGISFASKHLRFLWPEYCPVLDSVLSVALGYPLNYAGYRAFAVDCATVAAWLQTEAVANPVGRESGKWYAADVEMALFTLVR